MIQNNAVISTTTTNGSGFYSFTNLIPGTYSVQFVLPNGFTQVSPDNVGSDATDSDGEAFLITDPLTLASGENNPTLDQGFYNLASLGDFVWHDQNANGIQEGTEPGIPGATVHLIQNNTIISTTTTNGSGFYSFTNLIPGTYSVQFVLPNGFTQVSPDNVGSDATDSDGEALLITDPVTLASGENNPTLDQGFYNLASLGDFVWHDQNANGIQEGTEPGIPGATVRLIQNNAVISTTTTNGSGFYSFTNLIPGTYSVQFVLPNGYTQASPDNVGSDATDSDGEAFLITDPVTLASGENNPTLDQGFYNLASLGDFVWHDQNANGIQEGSEPGIPGATVHLIQNNTIISTTTTNGSGFYSFTNLIPAPTPSSSCYPTDSPR